MTISNDNIATALHSAGERIRKAGKDSDAASLAFVAACILAVEAEYEVPWDSYSSKGKLLASGTIRFEDWLLRNETAMKEHRNKKNAAIYGLLGLNPEEMSQTVRNNLTASRNIAAGAIKRQSQHRLENKPDFYRLTEDGGVVFDYSAVMPRELAKADLPADSEKAVRFAREHDRKMREVTYEAPKPGQRLGMTMAKLRAACGDERGAQSNSDAEKAMKEAIKAIDYLTANIAVALDPSGDDGPAFDVEAESLQSRLAKLAMMIAKLQEKVNVGSKALVA